MARRSCAGHAHPPCVPPGKLRAAAEKATRAIPREATRKRNRGKPGVARNMPIIAVKTMRLFTRGLQQMGESPESLAQVRELTVVARMVLSRPGILEEPIEVGPDVPFGSVSRP